MVPKRFSVYSRLYDFLDFFFFLFSFFLGGGLGFLNKIVDYGGPKVTFGFLDEPKGERGVADLGFRIS